MSATLRSFTSWEGDRDAEGHRTWTVVWRVETNDSNDGPAVVMQTPGLPLPGTIWSLGNDLDVYAWCRPTTKVKAASECRPGDKPRQWDVTQTFSTKPVPRDQQRCNTTQVEDPLLEPQKVSGSFTVYTEQGAKDRWGRLILSSSWESLTGPENEWDAVRQSVDVEQNVYDLELPLITQIGNDPLNSTPMWGLPVRSIKCVPTGWDRRFYGTCYKYYTRKFQFQIRVRLDPQTGTVVGDWDRDLRDVGSMYLGGPNAKWDPTTGDWAPGLMEDGSTPNRTDPRHFTRAVDRTGNLLSTAVLDGKGSPAGGETTQGETGPYTMSLISVGHDPGDTQNPDHWVPLVTDPTPPAATAPYYKTWSAGTYVRGAIRTYPAATANYVQTNPAGSSQVPGVGSDWFNFGTAVSQGVYDVDLFDTYGTGGYVTFRTLTYSGPGQIHVEKYGQSNLLLLGIPLFF